MPWLIIPFFFCLLQENSEWNEWQTTVLQERAIIENVYRWACGYALLSLFAIAFTQSNAGCCRFMATC